MRDKALILGHLTPGALPAAAAATRDLTWAACVANKAAASRRGRTGVRDRRTANGSARGAADVDLGLVGCRRATSLLSGVSADLSL